MHPELHKYLDGEVARSALSPEAAAELAEWESLDALVAQRRAERAPPWLVNDVMRALPEAHVSPLRRAVSWLLTPRPIRIAPLMPLAVAAGAIALVVLTPRGDAPTAVLPATATATAADVLPTVYVQFELNAAGAQSVSVAGDFNNWSKESGELRDPDGDGVWVGMVPVQAGVHKYMFVVDGEQWVTDPRAEGYVDDGFGMRNALMAVRVPAERTT